MLLNTYTAKGRAIARTLSTSFLRDETRLIAGTHGRVSMLTCRGELSTLYPVRVCRWLANFLAALPAAPDSAALLAEDEIFYIELRTVLGGSARSAFYKEDAWPVFRALISHNQGCIRRRKREIARNNRAVRLALYAQQVQQKGGLTA